MNLGGVRVNKLSAVVRVYYSSKVVVVSHSSGVFAIVRLMLILRSTTCDV